MDSSSRANEVPAVSAMLEQLWVKFRPQIEERLSVLQEAAAALAEGNLSPALRAQAHSAAHKLAGSLGTFGLDQGTALAREAENLLAPESTLDEPAAKRLLAIAASLSVTILDRS
jgi:HPt (histidine-containing phosphotransfer) domain-containing protein